MTKACQICKEVKPLEAFSKNQTRCKDCFHLYYQANCDKIKARSRQRKPEPEKQHAYYLKNRIHIIEKAAANTAANPERRKKTVRTWHLATNFKLTPEAFDAMLAAQNGCCAICKRDTPGGKGTWHIDHDHNCCPGKVSCGKCIRGLLCGKCNSALGMLNDDLSLFESAISYLKAALKSQAAAA